MNTAATQSAGTAGMRDRISSEIMMFVIPMVTARRGPSCSGIRAPNTLMSNDDKAYTANNPPEAAMPTSRE